MVRDIVCRHNMILATCGIAVLWIVARFLLARSLRNRRQRQRQKQYHQNLNRMTNNDAHPIIRDLQQIEFPFAFEVGLAASLIRPYGIPSISSVLAKTKQFADVHVASRRTADTACLVIDMSHYPPESERACAAISRMNYIHGQYQKASLVKNEDLLYTLALLAWLPVRFIERWEWRALDEAELYAVGVYWKSIGDSMDISYDPMESFGSPGSAKNGKEFMEKLRAWSDEYEGHMLPHPHNTEAARATEVVLLYGLPRRVWRWGRQALSAVMDDKLREALQYPKPGIIIYVLVHGMLHLRRLYLRYLAFPRNKPHLRSTEEPDSFGRYFRTTWAAEPWYVKPNGRNRGGIKARLMRLRGLPLPGDEGLKSQGYKTEEIGPERFEGKGLREFDVEKERLMASKRGGCPFGS